MQPKQILRLVRAGRRKAGADWLPVVAESVVGDLLG